MNLPTQNQNPGDLKDPTTGAFRQFGSPAEGKAALYNDLTAKMTGTSSTGLGPDSSLVEFSKVYAPASDKNNPLQYAANLANHLGVSPDTKIGTLTGRIDEFANAISQNEGYQGNAPKYPFTSQSQSDQSSSTPSSPYIGTLGTNPNDSAYGKVIDNSITRGIMNLFPGAQIGKSVGNSVDALTGLATGDMDRFNSSSEDNSKLPGKVALDAAGVVGTLGGGEILGGLLKGADVLASPAVKSAIQGFKMSMPEFQALSSVEKEAVLNEALAKETVPAFQRGLQKAIDFVKPLADKEAGNTPGLLKRAVSATGGLLKTGLKKVGGAAVGAGLGYDAKGLYDKIVK